MTVALQDEVDSVALRPPTEVERQERVIAGLGEGYLFPLFNGRQAIESQRKSGYRSTSRAAREIIDNAYEAGAKNVWVAFRRAGDGGRVKGEYKEAVTAIAFIDDGPGMLPQMARYALSWGGGTHFENPTGIGRFGFGLPNSSINQTRRVEVYTRTDPNGWLGACSARHHPRESGHHSALSAHQGRRLRRDSSERESNCSRRTVAKTRAITFLALAEGRFDKNDVRIPRSY